MIFLDKVKAELIDFIREHPEDGEQAEDLLMVANTSSVLETMRQILLSGLRFALDDKVRKS